MRIRKYLCFETILIKGIYLLSPEVLSYIPKDTFFDLPDLFKKLQEENLVVKSYQIKGFWVDMGCPTDYEKINREFNQCKKLLY